MKRPDLRHRCIAELCKHGRFLRRSCGRIADVQVRSEHATVYYCKRHAHRWCDPTFVLQPATAVVLAGRTWDGGAS